VRWETDIVDGPLVRADGIGIAPDEQAHIFDRFYRASNATADHAPGIGLGSRSPGRSWSCTAVPFRSPALWV